MGIYVIGNVLMCCFPPPNSFIALIIASCKVITSNYLLLLISSSGGLIHKKAQPRHISLRLTTSAKKRYGEVCAMERDLCVFGYLLVFFPRW